MRMSEQEKFELVALMNELLDVDEDEMDEAKRRVRGGKVVRRLTAAEHRKAQMAFKRSSKRRQALAKARRKTGTSTAKRKRARSHKRGEMAGLYR